MQKSVILHFPRTLLDKPIISHIVKTFDVEMNILQAAIMPEEAGHMFSILRGGEKAVQETLAFLERLKVRVLFPARNLVLHEEKCVHCGACVGPCRTGALSVDPETRRVSFDSERCIACNLCIPACAYGAIESVSEHLRAANGFLEDGPSGEPMPPSGAGSLSPSSA